MSTYSFTIDIARDLTDAEVDELFEAFRGDVMSGIREGQAYLGCDIEAGSIGNAMGRVAKWLLERSIEPKRIEVESESMDLVVAEG